MQAFFTWEMLATYSGVVLATTLLTQILKNISFLKRIPTRLLSYILAVILLLLSACFTKHLTTSTGILSLLNAAVVSFASNGAFDASRMTRLK